MSHNKAITLAIATVIGSMMLAACDRTEQKAAKAEADKPVANPNYVDPSLPKVALGAPATAAEEKEAAAPVQGQVDSKEPEQRRDFEQTK